MERQRSFSIKSMSFLGFCFTISSSFIFLAFISFWVFKSTPSLPIYRQSRFQLKHSLSNNQTSDPITVQSLAGLSRNSSATSVKAFILSNTQFNASENTTGFLPSESTREKIESRVRVNEVKSSTSGLDRAPAVAPSFEIEDRRDEKIEEEETKVAPGEKKMFPISQLIQKKGNEDTRHVKRTSGCDVTKGRWVYDESYPLYTNFSCPFIDEGFNCMSNGRPDKDYTKLKWQPRDCDLPRFDATKLLESIRGKRLVFVGDSINRNQWESMLCLLMSVVRDPKKVYETHGRRITKEKGNYSFKFVDYKCTVEYYVSHHLVQEGKARVGRKRKQTLRIDQIDRGSSRWKGSDILVFNTAHWWSHYKTKSGINYYQEGDQVHPKLDVTTAYRRALMTWGSWVDKYIKPSKTRVFFRNSAPSHFRGGQWNSGGHCRETTRPLNETPSFVYPEKNVIVEEVIKQMKTPVTVLNISSLSEYRIEGHPSIYGRKPEKGSGSSGEDCSHWCLPGVPDAWNELLYFHLQPKHHFNNIH